LRSYWASEGKGLFTTTIISSGKTMTFISRGDGKKGRRKKSRGFG